MILLEKVLLVAALVALMGFATSQVHSFDIFWQLQSAKYMLQTQSFIYTDVFSLAAEVPRHEHCWLHDIIVYGCWWLGGYSGISVLKGVLVLGTALVVVAVARLRGASWLAILFIAPPALLLTRGGWLERPQLWTFFFFSLFVLILESYRKSGGKVVFLLLPLMLLWANLHAGAILALAILAAYLVGVGGELFIGRSTLPKSTYRRLLWVTPLVAAASLVTPYAHWMWRTLIGQVLVMFPLVSGGAGTAGEGGNIANLYNLDWRSTTFEGDPLFFFALGIAGLLLLFGWRRLALSDLCLLGGVAFLGLKLGRHTPFFFLAAAALLPVYADAVVWPLVIRLGQRSLTVLRLVGQTCAVAIIVSLALPAYHAYGMFQTGLRSWHYPVEATEFVKEQTLPGNLYNTYDWGGYLMWVLYPDYKVFWDGRSDSAEMFRFGLLVMKGLPGWEDILNRFEVKTVVTKACTVDTGQHYPVIDRLRESPDWGLVFADESSLVFVRTAAVEPAWLKRYRLPDERIDDTILSEATLLTGIDPRRYLGWNEMARIYLARRQFPEAFRALNNYLSRAPEPDPLAEAYFRALYPMMKQRKDLE